MKIFMSEGITGIYGSRIYVAEKDNTGRLKDLLKALTPWSNYDKYDSSEMWVAYEMPTNDNELYQKVLNNCFPANITCESSDSDEFIAYCRESV